MGITNQNHLKSKHTKYKSITVKKIDRLQTVFINNTWLKLAKNQAKAKQHSEAELLLFENYLLFFYQRYHAKIIGDRPRHGHKYTKYKTCLSLMMALCIKQHLNKI